MISARPLGSCRIQARLPAKAMGVGTRSGRIQRGRWRMAPLSSLMSGYSSARSTSSGTLPKSARSAVWASARRAVRASSSRRSLARRWAGVVAATAQRASRCRWNRSPGITQMTQSSGKSCRNSTFLWFLYCSSGFLPETRVPAGTDWVRNTLLAMTAPSPMMVSPPRIEAPE